MTEQQSTDGNMVVPPVEHDATSYHTSLSAEYSTQTPLLDEAYGALREDESRFPNPDDIISVHGLKADTTEYESLKESGLDVETLDGRGIRRGDLLNAGYVFHNRLGNGEKAIISGQFPDPDDPEKSLDFTHRVLLTRPELEKVYKYQCENTAAFGISDESLRDMDEIRKDMLSFLSGATARRPFASENDFLDRSIPVDNPQEWVEGIWGMHISDPAALTDENFEKFTEDIELVSNYWKEQVAACRKIDPDSTLMDEDISFELAKAFAETCSDIYVWPGDRNDVEFHEERGHFVKTIPNRRGALAGSPSPFLESGFVFGYNPDAEVGLRNTPGQTGLRRLNMATLHIAGGHPDFLGLGEMGDASHDQTYMTIGTYLSELYPAESDDRIATQQSELHAFEKPPTYKIARSIQERLLAAARTWRDGTAPGSTQGKPKEDWRAEVWQSLQKDREQREAQQARDAVDEWL